MIVEANPSHWTGRSLSPGLPSELDFNTQNGSRDLANLNIASCAIINGKNGKMIYRIIIQVY